MKMERKAFLVEHLLLLQKKGGDPVGVILVNFPGKAKELIEQTVAGNKNSVAGIHMMVSQMTFISRPTFLRQERAISICCRVWVAIRLILMSELFCGTAGGTTGFTNTPSS